MREVAIEDRLSVDASPDTVWAAIEDPARHAAWHPFLTKIEGEHALGAERICSVQIGGKPARTRESCIVAEPAQRMIWRIDDDTTGFNRMVSDWSAGFTLAVRNGGTLVTAQSVFRPRNVFVLLMMPCCEGSSTRRSGRSSRR